MNLDLRTSAVEYSRRGFSVIPLRPRDKRPVGTWKNAQERRLTPDEVDALWARTPKNNIGIVTGAISGFVVLDWDGDGTAHRQLTERGLPETPTVTTGKGRHYYFKHPGFSVPNGVRVIDGCDLRGDGGYVVAPPSIHPNQTVYRWESDNIPSLEDFADMPDWLLTLVRERSESPDNAPKSAPTGHDLPEGRGTLSRATVTFLAEGSMPGERNQRLFNAACDMNGCGFAVSDALSLLVPVSRQCGTPDDEARKTILSAFRLPRDPARPDAFRPEATAVSPLNVLRYNRTEAGFSELFADTVGIDLQYDHRRGRWLVWNGNRFAPESKADTSRYVLDTARITQSASREIDDGDTREAVYEWASSFESTRRRDSALDWARGHPNIAREGDEFDTDALLLGVENGVIDLRTGEYRSGKRDDLITMSAGVRHQAGAECPRWLRFLSEVFDGDAELVAFMQRAVGYCLSGSVSEQVLFLCYGSGMNGKTVLLNVLSAMLGDYSATTPFTTFESFDTRQAQASPDVAALDGKRFVSARETQEARRLNESRVKAVTGGDPITARFLYGNHFTYAPRFKVWLAVNHLPTIRDTSDGMWRRVRLIPFSQSFKGRADKHLEATLLGELPGILNWSIQGCLDWQQRDGLDAPDVVLAATDRYRELSDEVALFLSERCHQSGGAEVGATELHTAYVQWCENNGESPLKQRAFGGRMTDCGFERKKSDGRNVYIGVGLSHESQPLEE